jgi:hypothetical protein
MFDAPIDAYYVWAGLSAASVALVGLAVGLPTAPPPNAAAVADAVDAVAASPYPSTAEHPTDADALRVDPRRVAVRDDAGTTRATLAFGPVTPAGDGPLGRVLDGVPPADAFDSPDALEAAARRARKRGGTWLPTDDAVRIRKVTWGETDVTLVGA